MQVCPKIILIYLLHSIFINKIAVTKSYVSCTVPKLDEDAFQDLGIQDVHFKFYINITVILKHI